MQRRTVMGPAGMSAAIVKTLYQSLNQTLRMPDLREKISGEAVERLPMSPEQFGQFVVTDIARWTKLARDKNIYFYNLHCDIFWLKVLKNIINQLPI